MSLKKLSNGRWQVRWRDGTGKQRAENFRSRELAQEKLRALHRGEADDRAHTETTFRDVVADWKRDRYPALSPSTRARYDDLLRLYFDRLMPLSIRQVTPAAVDDWIRWLKEDPNRFKRAVIRTAFKYELVLLQTVLRYYEHYRDDPAFTMPVKKRHHEAATLRNRRNVKAKDLTEGDFLVFRQRLEQRYGVDTAALATLQFYQALRVSEAVALRWEDVSFDPKEPWKSRLSFRQHVLYVRSKGGKDSIEAGLKNSDQGKEHPMLPEVYGMLRRMHRPGAKGLVFRSEGREFLSYHQVRHRYTRAFEDLGLPYSSTHVMRHGGTRKTFDETGGDLGIAAQQLGNSRAVDVYAKRSVLAFTRYAEGQWGMVSAPNVHAKHRRSK